MVRDQEAEFAAAFEEYSDALFRHCFMRLSDRERALELTQEAFLRAWDYLMRGKTIEQYRPFLYRTLNNLIIDEYRRHKTQSLDAMLEYEETALAVEGELLRDDTDLAEEAAVRLESEQAMALLAQLPQAYRTVVVMRYVDGLAPGEIAEFLGESENAISVRLHRGMRKLRELFTSSPHIRP